MLEKLAAIERKARLAVMGAGLKSPPTLLERISQEKTIQEPELTEQWSGRLQFMPPESRGGNRG